MALATLLIVLLGPAVLSFSCTEPNAFAALKDTNPSSSARFPDDIAQSVMYTEQPQNISLQYAMGNVKPGARHWDTGLMHHSLLDATMDSAHFPVANRTEQLNKRQPVGTGPIVRPLNTYFPVTGYPPQRHIKPGKPPFARVDNFVLAQKSKAVDAQVEEV